jgi:TonB family protein
MIIPERSIGAAKALLLAVLLIVAPCSLRSQESSDGPRKVMSRVPPQYPSLARSMNIRGNVKVAAVVVPNGTVKSVEVKGGHPILAQAAEDAIRRWKWEPLSHATTELIEIKFDPQ